MTRSEVSGSKDYDLGGPRIWGGVWGGCDQVLVENVFLQFFKDFDISMNNKIILKTDLQRDLSGKSQPSWKSVQTTKKTRLNSPKNHMCRWYDDTQLCKISYPITPLHLWNIKITNFKPETCPYDLLVICYFYISQTKSSFNKIFDKVMYHHIICTCDFCVNFDDFFHLDLHEFLRKLLFPPCNSD
jgi:hypothetical protein